MKIRVGYGLGNLRSLDGARLGALAEAIERHGFDSLWLSERISGPAPDPMLGLTFAAARTSTHQARHERAGAPRPQPGARSRSRGRRSTRSSGGRALPAFGLGIVHPVEQQAFGVERKERAAIFDEALPLIRRLWSEDAVDHDGTYFHYEAMTVLPKPAKRLDVWLGGKAPSELRRVGKLSDGWLASFSTPEDCKAARATIEDAAATPAGRIDDDHFGAMVFYAHEALPDRLVELLAARNPGADPRELVAQGWPAVRELCERFVAVGFSKLVLVPFTEPDDWDAELARAAEAILSIQN